MHTFSFLIEYWWVALWIGGAILAYVFGGWRLALLVATLGASRLIFHEGGKHAEADRRKRDQEMKRRLEDGYNEIDKRGVSRDDVSKRLRDGKF